MSAVDDGVGAGRRSLSPSRAEKVDFVLYKGPPQLSPLVLAEELATAEEEWMTRANYIEDDLHWLLKLPHDRFWCQVLHDASLHECIGSFLHCSPRPYDLDIRLSPEMKQKNESLLRLFFFVCLRMSTHKESKENCLSPNTFGEMIYEHFILDIPKIMDICVVFGRGNEAIVGKMVANIFAQQKRYYDDLKVIVSTTVQVFDTISTNFGFTTDLLSPPKQLKGKEQCHRNQLIMMPPDKFQDIIVYLSDIAHTLRCFFDIFHEGAVYFSNENFPLKMAALYEAASAGFFEAFKKRDDADENISSGLLKRALINAKGCFLHIFHKILFHSFLEPLIGCDCAEGAAEYAEGYLIVFTGILSEKRFLADLQALFPFADDKDILLQSVYKIDHTRLQYIEDAISEALVLFRQTNNNTSSKEIQASKQGSLVVAKGDRFQNGDHGYDPYEALGACAPRVNGIELESLTSSVKDLFPELGDGFIKLCLEEYNYDCEKVVSAILENSLSPALQSVDRTLTSAGVNDKQAEDEIDKNSVLGERSNVFDGDEFDMFQRAVDTSKIHVGKKNKAVDIDNRTELSGLKSFYQKFDKISEFVEVGNDDYNDEYDDTYDLNVVGTIDDDSPDELAARRPFVTPRVFEKPEAKGRAVKSSSGEEDSQDEQKRDHFVQDPAKLRQMREERYAARAMNQRRGRGHQGHQAATSTPQETGHDVKGGPKGQGQSQEVLRNRAFKERHKGARVHHNRKDLSDRKHKI